MEQAIQVNHKHYRAEVARQNRSDAINRALADRDAVIAKLQDLLVTVMVASGGAILVLCCALAAALKGGAA